MKDAALRRSLERELIDGLAAKPRRALIERLRGNATLRRAWDRAIASFRALEQREVSQTELDQVERWLFEDLADEGLLAAAPAPARTRRSVTLAAMFAALASTAALLVVLVPGDESGGAGLAAHGMISDELVARGGLAHARPLALELVCGKPARPAAQRGCTTDELLGFSIRLGDETLDARAAAALAEAPLHLAVFGIDERGELLYYTPTPAEHASELVRLGEPAHALPLAIRLGINHRSGRVRVYALAGEQPVDVATIERWAAALHVQPPAGIDDPPWHLRLAPSLLGPACQRLDRCASAQTELWLTDPREPTRNQP
jgi:hypothetical protein